MSYTQCLVKIEDLKKEIQTLNKRIDELSLRVANPEWLDVLIMDLINEKLKDNKLPREKL